MDDPQASSESFPQLKEIDDVLRCGICYETIKTPVITSCSHTFCSLCIRRWLNAKQICPSCSETIYETTLRKNTIVGNVLDAVLNLKKKILGRKGINPKTENEEDFKPKSSPKAPPATPKPKRSAPQPTHTPIVPKTPSLQTSPVVQPKTPSVRTSPMVHRSPEVASTPRADRPQPVDDDRSPAIKVPCPVCQAMMPQRLVNDHLDRCLLEPKPRPSQTVKIPSTQMGEKSSPKFSQTAKKNIAKSSTSGESSNPPLEPIKKMVYHLLTDKQMKAELKKYGLSTHGDRRTLLSRLQKFVILHKAECDSDQPRSLAEIIQQLEREEKAVSSASAVTNFTQMFKKTNNPEEIESAYKDYRIQNQSSFQKLIEDVRNRKKSKPPPKEACVTLSDSEDDPKPLSKPVPENTFATSSVKVDSDTDSDFAPEKSVKQTTKIASKKKRKCIESESEDDEEEDDSVFKKLKRHEKKAEEPTSPVLSRQTPARQLRSRTIQSKTTKKESKTPQMPTRNSKRGQKSPKQILTRGIGKNELSSDSSDEDNSVIRKEKAVPMQEKQRSPTPDLFEPSPAASSSSIPCGQRVKIDNSENEGSENDALDALVEMIKNDDTGSTTDFED